MKRYFQTFFTQQNQIINEDNVKHIPLSEDYMIVPKPGEFIPVSLEDYNNLSNSMSSGYVAMSAKEKDTVVSISPLKKKREKNLQDGLEKLKKWIKYEWNEDYISKSCIKQNLWPTKSIQNICYFMNSLEKEGYIIKNKTKEMKKINNYYRASYWEIVREKFQSNPSKNKFSEENLGENWVGGLFPERVTNDYTPIKTSKQTMKDKEEGKDLIDNSLDELRKRTALTYVRKKIKKWREEKTHKTNMMPQKLVDNILSLSKYYSIEEIIGETSLYGCAQKKIRTLYEIMKNKDLISIAEKKIPLLDKVALLKEKGLTYVEMAKILKISRATIWLYLKKLNLVHQDPSQTTHLHQNPNAEVFSSVDNDNIGKRYLEIVKPNGSIIRIQGLYPKEIHDIIDKYGND